MAKDCCCCCSFFLLKHAVLVRFTLGTAEVKREKKSTYFFSVGLHRCIEQRSTRPERESFVVVKIQFWRFLIFASLVVRFLSSAARCCCYLCTQFAFFTIVRTSFSGTRTKKQRRKKTMNERIFRRWRATIPIFRSIWDLFDSCLHGQFVVFFFFHSILNLVCWIGVAEKL